MAQHDYNIANQSGADFRADLNNALLAIATVNSGATEPSTTFAHQLWVDTSSSVLKIRNAADNAWITTGVSITASNTFTGDLTGNVTGNLTGNVTGNVTGDLTGNADSADILSTARTISLSGDVVGSVSFDGSANVDIDTVVQINSITLGTDTTGDYVESLSGGTGVIVTGGTGEGSTPSIAIGQAVATTDNVTFNTITATDQFIGDIRGAVRFNAKADGALSKGDVVYISGVSGDVATVGQAKADDASKMPAFGFAAEDANDNAAVEVVTFGTLAGLDTSGVSEGQVLYVSTTAGEYTTTKPTGESALLQNIGKVQRSHATEGSIKVGGAGRSNATPNLNDGNIFIGNASNQAVTTTLDTSIVVENTNLYYTTTRANTDFDTRLATKDTGDLTEGSNLYYTTARVNSDFDTRLATKSTTDLAEGTNLYYTSARFDSAFTSKDTDDLSEGSTNLYYTTARFDSAFGNKTTSDLTEGTNLYYTDTRANSAIDTRVTKAFVDALGIQASSVDANSVTLGTDTVGNYVATITGTANKITVTGSGSESANITLTLPDDVQIADSLTVAGNLTVNGTLTSLDTTNLDIEDNLFQLNAGLTGSPVNDSGMLINRGTADNGIFMWDESVDKFTLGLTTADGTATGNITLSSLGTLVANLEGNVTGTIQTAAQPNITSLGTLTGLTTTGDINFGNNDKAVFGDNSELKIYFDGFTAWFDNDDTVTKDTQIKVEDGGYISLKAGTDTMIQAAGNSNVSLYYDNSPKLATTSTGIDVTGTVTADGLTVSDGTETAFIPATADRLRFTGASFNYIQTTSNLQIAPAGDLVLFGTSAEIMRLKSGKVGINNSNPATALDVTGTVTADGLIVDTSTLVVDSTNNRVGIGNASPSNLLTLRAATGSSHGIKFETAGWNHNVRLGTIGTSGNDFRLIYNYDLANTTVDDSGQGTSYVRAGSGLVRFGTGATNSAPTDKLVIDSSGDVGIGVTSPTQKLHVKDADYTYIQIEAGTTGHGAILNLGDSTDADYGSITQFATAAGEGGRMRFIAGTTETMNLRGGNVGIGETNPSSLLHVKASDTGIAPHPSSQITLEREGTNYLQFLTAETGTSGILFGDGSDIDVSAIRVDHNTTKMTFVNETVETMTLNGANVGIGTSSPAASLHLTGSNVNIALEPTGTNAFFDNRKIGGTTNFRVSGSSTNDTTALSINSSGNVGIGTSSPDTKLHLSGADNEAVVRLENSSTGLTEGDVIGALEFYKSDSSGAGVGVSGSLKAVSGNASGAVTDLIFGTSSTARGNNAETMRLTGEGNIGIGTDSPATSLHINSGTTDTVATFQSTDQFADLELTDSGGTSYIRQSNGSLILEADRANASAGSVAIIKVDNSEAMRIDASGNVGIGTSSPQTTLHLSNTTTAPILRLGNEDNSIAAGADLGVIQFYSGDDSGGGNAVKASISGEQNDTSPVSADLTFKTAHSSGSLTEHLRITSLGNVGIGTTSPTTGKLVIDADNNAVGLRLNGGTTTGQSFGSRIRAGTNSSDYGLLVEDTSANVILKVTGDGNVGIGTTSPENNLHIFTNSGDEGLTIKSTGDTSNAIIIDANRGNAGAAINALTGKWNGTTVADMLFLTGSDTTNKDDGVITFRTSSADNIAERMRIGSDGTLQTRSSDGLAPSIGSGCVSIAGRSNSSTAGILRLIKTGDDGQIVDFFRTGNTAVGNISVTPTATSYNTSSDYRLKENVDYDFNALDRVAQLKPARFNFIADETNTIVDGFLAHEVQDIVPEAIHGEKDAMKEEEYEITPTVLDDDGNVVTEAVMGTREVPEYQGIDQSKLVPLLTKAIQEQQAQIEALQSEINLLKGE